MNFQIKEQWPAVAAGIVFTALAVVLIIYFNAHSGYNFFKP